MANITKLNIYYEPAEGVYEYTKSFTLSFSRINEEDNTYKKKAILEHKSKKRQCVEEYKMKEIHIGAKELLEKIKKIDFDKEYTEPVENGETYCISYGDKRLITGKREEIEEILDLFNFGKLLAITHKHYEYIKDMDEYTQLLDILNNKLTDLSGEQLKILCKTFKEVNPYSIFQSMGWLSRYLDDIKAH